MIFLQTQHTTFILPPLPLKDFQFVSSNRPQLRPFQGPSTAAVLMPHQARKVPVGVTHLDVAVRAPHRLGEVPALSLDSVQKVAVVKVISLHNSPLCVWLILIMRSHSALSIKPNTDQCTLKGCAAVTIIDDLGVCHPAIHHYGIVAADVEAKSSSLVAVVILTIDEEGFVG